MRPLDAVTKRYGINRIQTVTVKRLLIYISRDINSLFFVVLDDAICFPGTSDVLGSGNPESLTFGRLGFRLQRANL